MFNNANNSSNTAIIIIIIIINICHYYVYMCVYIYIYIYTYTYIYIYVRFSFGQLILYCLTPGAEAFEQRLCRKKCDTGVMYMHMTCVHVFPHADSYDGSMKVPPRMCAAPRLDYAVLGAQPDASVAQQVQMMLHSTAEGSWMIRFGTASKKLALLCIPYYTR